MGTLLSFPFWIFPGRVKRKQGSNHLDSSKKRDNSSKFIKKVVIFIILTKNLVFLLLIKVKGSVKKVYLFSLGGSTINWDLLRGLGSGGFGG